MKFLKLAIISVVVLFIIMTALGLLLPSTVRVTRNITIQTSNDTLFNNIADITKWKLWMKGMDSTAMNITFTNAEGKATAALIGGQQVTINKATKQEIQTFWRNSRGAQQRGVFELRYDAAANSTNLNWYFEQKVKWYPWERLSTLANDKILGPFMEHSLDNLKMLSAQGNISQ